MKKIGILLVLFFSNLSFAETTCKKEAEDFAAGMYPGYVWVNSYDQSGQIVHVFGWSVCYAYVSFPRQHGTTCGEPVSSQGCNVSP